MGDGGVVGVFDCVALGCGEVWGFAFEEGGGGDVVLGVVGCSQTKRADVVWTMYSPPKRMRTRRVLGGFCADHLGRA